MSQIVELEDLALEDVFGGYANPSLISLHNFNASAVGFGSSGGVKIVVVQVNGVTVVQSASS